MMFDEMRDIIDISRHKLVQLLKTKYIDFYNYIEETYEDISFYEKLYLWINRIGRPVCECGNYVRFINFTKGYLEYCSLKCSNNSEKVKEKKKKKTLEKYGVDNVLRSKEIQNKRKNTCLERYGTEYASQAAVIKEKIQKTNIEKYGNICSLHSEENKIKVKTTWKEKYGTTNPSKNETIKDKIKKTNLERYGETTPFKNETIKDKIKKTNLERYGVENAKQIKLKQSNILEKLNDKNWLIEQNHILKKNLYQIKVEFSIGGEQVLPRYFELYGVEIKHYNNSVGCGEIISFLNENDIFVKENDRTIISPYEIDIFLPEYNIAIEYCGLYWHSTKIRIDKNYHYNKFLMCKDKNIKLITVFEDEWIYKKEIVKQKILHKIGKSSNISIGARKTEIKIVDNVISNSFLNENHIQGAVGGSVKLGLYYEGIIVNLMLLKKEDQQWNIVRYSSSKQVNGGFSKLLSFFISEYNPATIISFADLRWDSGDLYLKNGFVYDSFIRPDYFYIEGDRRIHKFNLRKSRIAKKYAIDVDSKTERELIEQIGLLKIYDCGKMKFVWRK